MRYLVSDSLRISPRVLSIYEIILAAGPIGESTTLSLIAAQGRMQNIFWFISNYDLIITSSLSISNTMA